MPKPPVSIKEPRRLGLWIPFALIVTSICAWSAYWFYTAHRIEGLIRQHQAELISSGYRIVFDPFKVRGFPYRMFVDFKNLTVLAPSGRGFSTSLLNAEANAYALDKWVMNTPSDLTIYRGHTSGLKGVFDLGKLTVTGRSLKASVSGLTPGNSIPSIAVQGLDVTLTPSDTRHPFAFSRAENVEFYVRSPFAKGGSTAVIKGANPPDSADVLLRVSGAHGVPGSVVGDLDPTQPFNLHIEGEITEASSLVGHGVTNWTAHGGQFQSLRSQLTAGDLTLFASSDVLSLDQGGHLTGRLSLDVTGTPQPLAVLGAMRIISPDNMTLAMPLLKMNLAPQPTQKFKMEFKDGHTYIGALKVSDAPILP